MKAQTARERYREAMAAMANRADAAAAREAALRATAREAVAALRAIAADFAIVDPVLDGRLRTIADRLEPPPTVFERMAPHHERSA